MFSDGGFELSLVFRACFVGALLDRGLGPPVRTVAVLRLCFFLAPILNYALALSNVRFKVRSIHWSPYDRVGVVNADP